MVGGALLSIFFFLSFSFLVGALQGAPEEAISGSNAEAQSNEGEPAVGSELGVEPAASEKTYEHTEGKLEPNRCEATDSFPVVLH